MAIKYLAGNRITGTNSDRTGLASGVTDYLNDGTLWLELVTNDMYKWDKDPRNLSMETIQVFKQLIEARANTGDLEADKIKSCMISLPKFMEYSNNNMHLTQRSS